MVKELKYPATTKQVMCYNAAKNIYHFVTVKPNQVCTTGQPTMDVFATKTTLDNKVKTLTLTEKNQEDYQRFINPVAAAKVIKG